MPTLGLCVIAKNAEATIRSCIESVAGLVSERIVVDTGSTDETAQIARECGAAVVSFPWCGDFSAARNAALAAISTDWVLVLDADEELDAAGHSWIRAELQAPGADGYVTPVRNYLQPWDEPLTGGHLPVSPAERHPRAPEAVAYVHTEVCRLYRRDPDIYYVGHIHEQVEYRMMQLGRPIGMAGFFIHHFGWYLIDEKGLMRKRELYHDLLAEKLRQRPDDPQVLLQYGDALCAWLGKVKEGLACFMQAAALKGVHPAVWMHIASALLQLGQWEAALVAVGQTPVGVGYAGRRAQFRAEALEGLGRREQARAAYAEALKHDPNHIGVLVKLALLEMQAGDRDKGEARMRDTLVRAEAIAYSYRHAHPYLRAAEMHALLKQWPDALRLLDAGLKHNPDALPLHELRMRAAVAAGRTAEAAEAAARIAELNSSPRSVLRHAAILNQSGNPDAALNTIAGGLKLFPLSNELQQAERELGAAPAMALA